MSFSVKTAAMYRLATLLLVLFLGVSFSARAQMPRTVLQASFHRIDAEIAATPEDRAQGLMFRQKLAANQGMLFIFTRNDRHCMWMRNTLIPLAVAFLDAQGKIINIEQMQAKTEDNHCATSPARYALEMNEGWFARKGLKPGQTIGGLSQLPPAR